MLFTIEILALRLPDWLPGCPAMRYLANEYSQFFGAEDGWSKSQSAEYMDARFDVERNLSPSPRISRLQSHLRNMDA
jgi:hypothetical protein